MNYNEMKVAELREETKKRGMTVGVKSRRFTKQELIDRLEEYDVKLNKKKRKTEKERQEETEKEKRTEPEEINEYTMTLEQIERRFEGRKAQDIYDRMCIGSSVAFIQNFETRSGVFVRKLRLAKVIEIDRAKERVKVVTKYNPGISLKYSELLYIMNKTDINGGSFPAEILRFIREQCEEAERMRKKVREERAKSRQAWNEA